jgi:hypothetical protein
MEDNRNILGILSSAIGEYLNLRTDDFRKNIIESLSVGFSRVLAILVITMLSLIVLAVFAFAFIVLLGQAIGSLSGAAFIIGGLYLTGVVILFLLRKRLFLDMFTNLFTGIVGSDNPADSWKTLLLTVVKNLRNNLNAS